MSVQVDLSGKNALVTGAARGLGAAVVRRLTAAGAAVWAVDVRDSTLKALAEELSDRGGQVHPLVVDVRDAEQVAGAVKTVAQDGGRLDILVNNAAVDVTKAVTELAPAEADLVVTTDLLAPMYFCLEGYRRMVEQRGGHIINILSTAALRTWTEASLYAASKTGLRAFTHTLFQEARRDCLDVGVTGIISGGLRTGFILERFPDADVNLLQDPAIVADALMYVLSVPPTSSVSEIVVVPRNEPSWP
jgi:NAD(P)-dependent dehydrogenase (short-subunit alcohol dehydrogenase family)